MAIWTKQKLSKYIDIKHGFAFKGEHFCDKKTNYILLTPGNFAIGGGFQNKKIKYYDGPISKEYVLKDGDLIVSMTDLSKKGDTLGFSAIIPNHEGVKYLHNQRIGLVKKKREFNLKFLFYLLRTHQYQRFVVGSASGATVRHTSPSKICQYMIDIPEMETQNKIADVLTAYDDLIENNEKRIRILEEMAQRLYTEWFVKFNLPAEVLTKAGFADRKLKMVDSGTEYGTIPEGWEVKKLGEVIELAYGKALKEDKRIFGNIPVYGSSGIVGTHNKSLVSGPGIVVGRKGNVGSVYWTDKNFYPIDTTYYVKTSLNLYFVYYLLKGLNFISSDVAVPGLSRNQVYTIEIIIPPKKIIEVFAKKMTHYFGMIRVLRNKTSNLSQIRDLLIPQLVTGKRDVK